MKRIRKRNKFKSYIKIILAILVILSIIVFLKSKVVNNNFQSSVAKFASKQNQKSKEIKPETIVSNNNTHAAATDNINTIDKNYAAFFKKDVFIGDSITEGLAEYDILNEENVCAKLGLSLDDVDAQTTKAVSLKPEKVFLLLGSNDIEYEQETPKAFADKYKQVINRIKLRLPEAKLYIQSILPVLSQAAKQDKLVNNTRIDEFNAAVKQMAEQEKLEYINIASVLNESNKNLYEQDGEHFKIQFYPLWLNYVEANIK